MCIHTDSKVKTVKLSPSHMAQWAALISVSVALSQTPASILRDNGNGTNASPSMFVYFPAKAGTRLSTPEC